MNMFCVWTGLRMVLNYTHKHKHALAYCTQKHIHIHVHIHQHTHKHKLTNTHSHPTHTGPQKSKRAGICQQAGCQGVLVSCRDITTLEPHLNQGPWVARTGLLCTDRRRVRNTTLVADSYTHLYMDLAKPLLTEVWIMLHGTRMPHWSLWAKSTFLSMGTIGLHSIHVLYHISRIRGKRRLEVLSSRQLDTSWQCNILMVQLDNDLEAFWCEVEVCIQHTEPLMHGTQWPLHGHFDAYKGAVLQGPSYMNSNSCSYTPCM